MQLKEVKPGENFWTIYLKMSYDYFIENWPKAILGQSQEFFITSYEKILKQRSIENPRKFFFLVNDETNEIVGLTNIYLDPFLTNFIQLQIAEFYITPNYRRLGNGKKFFSLITEWGKINSVTRIRIEVDKNFINANRFWKSLSLNSDFSGIRNVYFKDL
jgi:predicted acetyltransferase